MKSPASSRPKSVWWRSIRFRWFDLIALVFAVLLFYILRRQVLSNIDPLWAALIEGAGWVAALILWCVIRHRMG